MKPQLDAHSHSPRGQTPASPAWLRPVLAVLIAGATLSALWPLVHHPFTGFDDPEYISDNPHLSGGLTPATLRWAFTTGMASNWHPLTWLSHVCDVSVFNLQPGGQHLVNLLLHAASAVLLFLFLSRSTGFLWRSAFVAALFALHPLHVESVAWLSERKDVLSGFFFMLTLLAYHRYVLAAASPKSKAAARPRSSCLAWFIATLLLYACGLMSKPMLVTLPFLLLLLDLWPLGRAPGRALSPQTDSSSPQLTSLGFPRLLLEKAPFFLLAILSCIITVRVQTQGGTVASWHDFALPGRLANAVASYWKYLAKTLWPTNLSIFYPHPALTHTQWPAWQTAAATLALAGVCGLALAQLRLRPWLALGWFWFLGMLVPVIGIIQTGSQAFADRYTYLPLIGIFIICSWFLDELLLALRARWRSDLRIPAGAFGLALLCLCGVAARRQVDLWRDDLTLFGHAIEVDEKNPPAHSVLANAFARAGKFGLARGHCLAALQADPTTTAAWHTLGDVDLATGKPDAAVEDYRRALEIRPDSAYTWFRLGAALEVLGRTNEAVDSYASALRLRPDLVAAHNNLAILLWGQGKQPEALAHFAAAAQLSPRAADKHYNYGKALAEAGRLPEASAELAAALTLQPAYFDALETLGGVLALQRQYLDAGERFQQAARLAPTNAELRLKMGRLFLLASRTNQAAAAFSEAANLDPSLFEKCLRSGEAQVQHGQIDDALQSFTAAAWMHPADAALQERLGLLLAQRGKFDEAVVHLLEGVHLSPAPQAYYNLGLALAMQNKLAEAARNFEETLRLQPDYSPALNDLAWILGTAPQPELRNGPRAVELAERCCRLLGQTNLNALATLDAAYAEAGRFDDAIRTAQQVMQLATASHQPEPASRAASRLTAYRQHQPYRQ